MNISELARQLKTEPQVLREKLPELGIHIGERAIQIDDASVDRAKAAWKLWQRREALKQKFAQKQAVVPAEVVLDAVAVAIKLPLTIAVSDFARRLNVDVARIIIKLMQEGVMAAMNQQIDYETAHIIAEDFGIKTELSAEEFIDDKSGPNIAQVLSQEQNLELRSPVVVVMGHVDHGKTTLLDSIRKTKIADQESGAITQHIGAYQVKVSLPTSKEERPITFIDTPGHQAFKGMRSRGGQVADIAVLVISADDKIQPQTMESIEIIQKENLGLIVAINKIDKPEADIDRIKKQLAEINLIPEDWGGDVICVPVSAKQNKNIDELLENILLLAEIKELKANPHGQLFGTVIESHIDKGLGPVVTMIVQNGTLSVGDEIKCGTIGGRVKGLLDFRGTRIPQAGPSTPVKILGLKCSAQAGDIVEEADNLRRLKKATKKYRLTASHVETASKKGKDKLQIKVHLKTDVMGTLEALLGEINKIKHDIADIKVIKQSLGDFTETDVLDAEAEGSVLIGFKVSLNSAAQHLVSTRNVTYRVYNVIYQLLDDLRNSLEELLPPEIIEEDTGEADVLAVFSKLGNFMVIGGRVKDGHITKDGRFRIFRAGEIIGEGKVQELQSNKEVVKKVKAPAEFGLKVSGDLIIKEGDILRFYTVREQKRKL
ncbi:MAG: translation initiation factor IF-2 [Candidatus Jacksonbacteria bacterium RIFOXYC2_FULL_44_29]|nr:MAG: Translation initiation factor IF-2 [Parcubacteria group bacterium GW2011_GWA2_42_28]KKT54701.1 MAG: Translation initiation factor IF-2 [Parcubacteria group bacterium GW2011_GWC2_44_22]OGY75300.1 MAG: translation initiation factor IF-2 [Candidatus Jacksonbacteria bacterium RIFOXYA2_FULL_43_12]OGY76210.1 MAG: translation initiation factor IF-2 [Candidatus Jacksonbacteria bacterium RIFOXYB2_FULL_44_15]OGY78065.1 MAG: translation initiation factor IF-2 [Candidatus Jacksonbacteria bacterium 